MKIDSHLHLPVRDELLTPEDQKQCLLAELKLNGMEAGIVIPDNVPGSSIGDIDLCLELFEESEHIYLLFPVNILDAHPADLRRFEQLLEEKRVHGMKIFPGHDKHLPDDERLFPYFVLCAEYGVPCVIHTGWNSGDPYAARWNDPKYIVTVAEKYPSLHIVISHYYWPEPEYCRELTKDRNNIYFDTSALADEEVVQITGEQVIQRILKETISENPSRVLFGSDYGMCDIGEHCRLIESLDLNESEKELVYRQNTIDLFRLDG